MENRKWLSPTAEGNGSVLGWGVWKEKAGPGGGGSRVPGMALAFCPGMAVASGYEDFQNRGTRWSSRTWGQCGILDHGGGTLDHGDRDGTLGRGA